MKSICIRIAFMLLLCIGIALADTFYAPDDFGNTFPAPADTFAASDDTPTFSNVFAAPDEGYASPTQQYTTYNTYNTYYNRYLAYPAYSVHAYYSPYAYYSYYAPYAYYGSYYYYTPRVYAAVNYAPAYRVRYVQYEPPLPAAETVVVIDASARQSAAKSSNQAGSVQSAQAPMGGKSSWYKY